MSASESIVVNPSLGKRLRSEIADRALILPGVFNALTAKMAERLGFSAVYLSGGALSAQTGVPDIGLLTLPEFTAHARTITDATRLPLICDADTGFGETVNVERTIRMFEQVGAAGVHLEDQILPKRCGHLTGKGLIDAAAMCAKIRAAVGARRDPDFFIIARTDARSVEGFAGTVRRAEAYIAAGADAIFPEALETAEEFAAFAKAVPVPLLANMTEFGRSPNLDVPTLSEMGYRLILYPLTAFRVAMKAAEEALRTLIEHGHQRSLLPKMLTRAELYDLLDYHAYEARDRVYFGGTEQGGEE